MLLGPEPEQRDAQQRTALEVERGQHLDLAQLLGPRAPLGLRHRLEIDAPQLEGARSCHHLHGLTIAHRERRAQRVMPCQRLLQSAAQRVDVQLAPQLDERGNVVRRLRRRQLIEKPQPLLAKRQRQRPVAVDPRERRPRLGVAGPRPRRVDHRGEPGHRRRLEQAAQRQLHAQRGGHPGHQARGEERVPPQVEEVVVDAHGVDAEDLGPQRHQRQLGGGSRRARRAAFAS